MLIFRQNPGSIKITAHTDPTISLVDVELGYLNREFTGDSTYSFVSNNCIIYQDELQEIVNKLKELNSA